MNSTYYFGVMVRLFAIALFIYGIGRLELAATFQGYGEDSYSPSFFFSLSSSIIPILISIVLWFFPLTVARKILPSTDETKSDVSPHSLLTVIVLGIGIYMLYFAILDGVFWLMFANVFVKDELGGISKALSNEDKSNIVVTVIEFVLALVLIARAKTIASAMIRFSR